MSKALSAEELTTYFEEVFTNAKENYYSKAATIPGQWVGSLAGRFGLVGQVEQHPFARLALGQHPTDVDPATGQPIQLIRHQHTGAYADTHGTVINPMDHRGGWGPTVSASKSVSLAALVGGDTRVLDAHRLAVAVTWRELERFIQARMGNTRPPETTETFIGATFEHDSARPVNGYAAPQLHTHLVIFNLTEASDGKIRSLQPAQLFASQQYATAVYRSELARQLRARGYDIVTGAHHQPEIRGFAQAYLEAASPRRKQITDYLKAEERTGAAAAQIAAYATREAKLPDAHEDMRRRHQEMAAAHGDQPARAVAAALAHGPRVTPAGTVDQMAATSITYARERNIEQTAVFEDRRILTDALRRSMGHVPLDRVKSEFAGRTLTGEFIERNQAAGAIARAYTTPDMVTLEQQTLTSMLVGQHTQSPLARLGTQPDVDTDGPTLNPGQRAAVAAILESRDTIVALDGVAGSGKTTALAAIREAAEREGYAVQGLAPTSNAAKELQKAGMVTQTVQRYLVRLDKQGPSDSKHLHVLDESSLASTVQMHRFLTTLGPQDRVILVGDTRQHQSVEAGRIYEQLIDAGLTTATLDTIVRQKDAAYKAVVEQLASGRVREAIADLDRRGFVVVIPKRSDRVRAVADDFCAQPEGALVVAPANDARRALNDAIHAQLKTQRCLTGRDRETPILVERQETTGADRRWVHTYVEGDRLRYSGKTASLGINAGDYAIVTHVDGDHNRLTVQHEDGRTLTYDPNRLYGVNIYREETRLFAVGERVQFKQPFRDRDIANAKLGTILAVSGTGVRIKVDGREKPVAFTFEEYRHLDYGYAVTRDRGIEEGLVGGGHSSSARSRYRQPHGSTHPRVPR